MTMRLANTFCIAAALMADLLVMWALLNAWDIYWTRRELNESITHMRAGVLIEETMLDWMMHGRIPWAGHGAMTKELVDDRSMLGDLEDVLTRSEEGSSVLSFIIRINTHRHRAVAIKIYWEIRVRRLLAKCQWYREQLPDPKPDCPNGKTGFKPSRKEPLRMAGIALGQRIWRPVEFYGSRDAATPRIVNIRFRPAGRGSVMVRAVAGSSSRYFMRKGLVASSGKCGFVCFCQVPVPKNWTFFVVTRIHRGGRSATVAPVRGRLEQLLAQYEYPGALQSAS